MRLRLRVSVDSAVRLPSVVQVLFEELGDEGLDVGVLESAVAAALDGVEGCLDAGVLQGLVEHLALVVWDERVLVAVSTR